MPIDLCNILRAEVNQMLDVDPSGILAYSNTIPELQFDIQQNKIGFDSFRIN